MPRYLLPVTWCITIGILVFMCSSVQADSVRTGAAPGVGAYDEAFWPGTAYRDDVRSPVDFFGFDLGARPVRHREVLEYFEYLAGELSNVMLEKFGTTYEGRELVYLVVTSEGNAARLDEIRREIAGLADPRQTRERDARATIESTPAIAWMAYGIHGDELSSCDAAVQLAYQLAAGGDPASQKIRDELVVCIDPMENPDGRERWLKQMETWNGVLPNPDHQSLQHQGFWPWGRTNHYLFDMNRDWFALVHPESRARVQAILEWHPQYLLDAHEMGWSDTYLFSPPRKPFNPFMVEHIHKWWEMLSRDQAEAFDRYGWNYYTREWNEEFYPGYGSSWGTHIGAIGMLYEQARVSGSQVTQPDGHLLTFRETIHHQFVSSMVNLITLSENRRMLLEDYFVAKKKAVRKERRRDHAAAFFFSPSSNDGRLNRFVETLQLQGIEVEVATKPIRLSDAMERDGKVRNVDLPAGTVVVRTAQPLRDLIENILTFEIRLTTDVLEMERKEQLKHGRTKLYEGTGWSLPLAYNLTSYRVDTPPSIETKPYTAPPANGGIEGKGPRIGYAFDGLDDRSYQLLARLFETGHRVWCARRPFQVTGRRFEAGSFVVKRSDNPDLDESRLDAMAMSIGVRVYGVNSALGAPLADLGGGELQLLQPPRVALVGGAGTSSYTFGTIWHMLDARLEYPTSLLDIARLAGHDLRPYNVIVLPDLGSVESAKRYLGGEGVDALRTWVEAGGTLIAIGSGAAFLADSTVALTAVKSRAQVLEALDEYAEWLEWVRNAEAPVVDSLSVWENGAAVAKGESSKKNATKEPGGGDIDAIKNADRLAVQLAPGGAIVAVELDPEHWIGFGEPSPVPVILDTRVAYMAKRGVQVPARFARAGSLRLSGLLWPEARDRWAETAYAAREAVGDGQVILFADSPNFRAFFHGGERLLQNAIFLGPGFGASVAVEW